MALINNTCSGCQYSEQEGYNNFVWPGNCGSTQTYVITVRRLPSCPCSGCGSCNCNQSTPIYAYPNYQQSSQVYPIDPTYQENLVYPTQDDCYWNVR